MPSSETATIPRISHGGDFGDGLAFAADAGGADGPNANVAKGFGAIDDEASNGGIVVDGFRVWHAADGREAAVCCRVRAGFDGFGIFLAGLAQMGMHVNEAGRDDEAGGVKGLRAIGMCNFPGWRDFSDAFSIEKNVAGRVGLGRGIEDAPILNQKHVQIPWVRRRLSLQERDEYPRWRPP